MFGSCGFDTCLKTTYWKRFLTQDFFFSSQSISKLFTTQGWKGQAPVVFLLWLPLPHRFPPLLGSRQFLRWKLYCYSNCHWLWELSVPWDHLLALQLSIVFAATLVQWTLPVLVDYNLIYSSLSLGGFCHITWPIYRVRILYFRSVP